MSWSLLESPVQCICDGRYEGCTHGDQRGTCDNPPGGGTSPYWCTVCDALRLIDIKQGLQKLLAEIDEELETPERNKIKMIAESGLEAIQFIQEKKEAPGE